MWTPKEPSSPSSSSSSSSPSSSWSSCRSSSSRSNNRTWRVACTEPWRRTVWGVKEQEGNCLGGCEKCRWLGGAQISAAENYASVSSRDLLFSGARFLSHLGAASSWTQKEFIYHIMFSSRRCVFLLRNARKHVWSESAVNKRVYFPHNCVRSEGHTHVSAVLFYFVVCLLFFFKNLQSEEKIEDLNLLILQL